MGFTSTMRPSAQSSRAGPIRPRGNQGLLFHTAAAVGSSSMIGGRRRPPGVRAMSFEALSSRPVHAHRQERYGPSKSPEGRSPDPLAESFLDQVRVDRSAPY